MSHVGMKPPSALCRNRIFKNQAIVWNTKLPVCVWTSTQYNIPKMQKLLSHANIPLK